MQSALSNLWVLLEEDNADGYYDTLIARFNDLEAKVAAGNPASIKVQVDSLKGEVEKAMMQRSNDKLFGEGGLFEKYVDQRPYIQGRREDLTPGAWLKNTSSSKVQVFAAIKSIPPRSCSTWRSCRLIA